ncbi:MAG: hypothetical protein ABL986_17880 [Vicinamibacterales bacterium]
MSIGLVSESPEDTVGMIKAKRWSDLATPLLAGVIYVVLDWRMTLLFVAIAWVVRLEGKRVRAAQWPESYHAMRVVMDEHGFEMDREPQNHGQRAETRKEV